MTALKITKRAKIAGLASMALAVTSLTVVFASHSALASTSPRGDHTTAPATSTTTGTTTTTPTPTCTCQETPTPTPTTVAPTTVPPTTPAPTSAAPAPVAVTGSLPVTG